MPSKQNLSKKYIELLQSLARLHTHASFQFEKNKILESVVKHVSRFILWKNGWKFAKNTYTRVRQGKHLLPCPPPKHALCDAHKQKIKNFMKTIVFSLVKKLSKLRTKKFKLFSMKIV